MKYDGTDGWGVVPEHRRKDRPARTVQQTHCSLHDSSPTPEEEKTLHLPPVAKHTVAPKNAKRKNKDLSQSRFGFGTGEGHKYEVLESPVHGFYSKRIYEPEPPVPEVKLSEGMKVIKVPQNFEDLSKLYDLRYLDLETLFFKPEQARGIILAQETGKNLFLEADTSFGKSVLEWMIAAIELTKRNSQVVLLTPTVDLVKQLHDDTKLFLNLPPESIATLSGQVSVKERMEIYKDPRIRVIISTPDIFEHDISNNLVSPERFTLGLFDEGDKGVGKTGYLKVGKHLSQAGARIVSFSATLPDKEQRMYEMLDAYQIKRDNIYKLNSPPKKVFSKPIFHNLADEKMLSAASDLYNGVADCAEQLIMSMKEAIKVDDGILQEEMILKAFLKATKFSNERFDIPSNSQTGPIINALKIASTHDQGRFGKPYSTIAEFGYRTHLYHTLVRFGKFAFLSNVASDFLSYSFSMPRKKGGKGGKYFERVFVDQKLQKTFYKLAEGTLFEKLADPNLSIDSLAQGVKLSTWAERKEQLKQDLLAKKKTKDSAWWDKQRTKHKVEVRAEFLKQAAQQIAAKDDWYDGPALAFTKDMIRRHCTFGRSDKVIATTDSAEVAMFFPMVIERMISALGKTAVPFAGMLHLEVRKREENLKNFKYGNADAIFGTNGAIQLGLHSHANVLICLNAEITLAGQKQIRGRVGRNGRLAFIYDFICNGTVDFTRFYAARHRRKEEERLARHAG